MRRLMFVVAIVLLVAAALWRPVAVPQLVKFPSHLDETTNYRGTFTVHADPATGQPLPDPMSLPLEIDRRVHTLPGGGAHTAVLEEAVTYRVGDTTQRERHPYVRVRRAGGRGRAVGVVRGRRATGGAPADRSAPRTPAASRRR